MYYRISRREEMLLNEWNTEDFVYFGKRIEMLQKAFLATENPTERQEIQQELPMILDQMIEAGQDEVDDLSRPGKYVVTFETEDDEPINIEVEAEDSPTAQTKAYEKYTGETAPEDAAEYVQRISKMPDAYIADRVAEIMGRFPRDDDQAEDWRNFIVNKYKKNIITLKAMRDAIAANDLDAMREMAGSVRQQAFPHELIGSRKATEKERGAALSKAAEWEEMAREARIEGDFEAAKEYKEQAKAERERVPDIKFIRQKGEEVVTSTGKKIQLPPKFITAKPAADAMFQVPLAFIDNMMLRGEDLGVLKKGTGLPGARRVSRRGWLPPRQPKWPKREGPSEGTELEVCPICESDFCRCCPDCRLPDCRCEEIKEDRIRMISEFVNEDLIK
jgi:hypothetical protein